MCFVVASLLGAVGQFLYKSGTDRACGSLARYVFNGRIRCLAQPVFVAVALSLGMGHSTPTHAEFTGITTQQLLAYLDRVEADQQNFREEFEVTWYWAQGTAEPPKNFDRSQFVHSQRITLLYSHERYRAEITYLDTHPKLAAMKGQLHTLTWDGVEARFTTLGAHSRNPKQQGARIDNLPPREFSDLSINHWCGYWVHGNGYFEGYADLLRTSEVRGPRRVGEAGEELWQWSVASKLAMHGEILVTARRIEGQVVLHSTEFRVFKTAAGLESEDAGEMFLSARVEFLGNMLLRPRLLNQARYTIRRRPTDESEPSWGVCEIRLLKGEAVEPKDEDFRAVFTDRAIVGDTRYNIAYQFGDRDLNVDGRLYETHEPLRGDVGGRLQWWIEHATPVGEEAGAPLSEPARSGAKP